MHPMQSFLQRYAARVDEHVVTLTTSAIALACLLALAADWSSSLQALVALDGAALLSFLFGAGTLFVWSAYLEDDEDDQDGPDVDGEPPWWPEFERAFRRYSSRPSRTPALR